MHIDHHRQYLSVPSRPINVHRQSRRICFRIADILKNSYFFRESQSFIPFFSGHFQFHPAFLNGVMYHFFHCNLLPHKRNPSCFRRNFSCFSEQFPLCTAAAVPLRSCIHEPTAAPVYCVIPIFILDPPGKTDFHPLGIHQAAVSLLLHGNPTPPRISPSRLVDGSIIIPSVFPCLTGSCPIFTRRYCSLMPGSC